MNRREFTKNLSILIAQMIADGHEPVLDYLLRSKEEQKRLFAAGFSKCDGITHPSDHQKALAFDLYFVITNPDKSVYIDFGYEKTAYLAVKYHDVLVSMGGKKLIEWDKGHYGTG
jgi:hypothetical protein